MKRAYVDLDGPIADFAFRMAETGLPGSELKLIAGVYRNLPVVPGAVDAMHLLWRLGFHVWFLTKIPDENPLSATEKILWMQEHFPAQAERIILSPDKGCVGTVQDYLIDDHPEWANAHNFPGTIIKFDRGDETDTQQVTWDKTLSCLLHDMFARCTNTFVFRLVAGNYNEDKWVEKPIEVEGHDDDMGLTDEEYHDLIETGFLPRSVWDDVVILRAIWNLLWEK